MHGLLFQSVVDSLISPNEVLIALPDERSKLNDRRT